MNNQGTDDCTNRDKRPGYRAAYTPDRYPAEYDRSEDFKTFVSAAVDRYKGRVHAWGFSVEVHNTLFWLGTPRQLIDEVLRPGYTIVKQIDPAALVVGPDEDVEDALDWMLKLEADEIAQGKGRLFDVLTSHGFAHSGWLTPDQLEREWRGPSQTHCAGFESTANTETNCHTKYIIERYRNGRPFWFTEFGYQTSSAADVASQTASANYLATWIQGITARPWIDKAFVFALRYDNLKGADFGMFANTAPDARSCRRSRGARRAGHSAAPEQRVPRPRAPRVASSTSTSAVANPNPVPAPVKVSFLKPDGSVELVAETLAANVAKDLSRRAVAKPSLAEHGGLDGCRIHDSDCHWSTERTMFWDATYYGGHGGTAVSAPATTWYFGEGSQGFFDTYVLLANSTSVTANVTVTFLLEGEPPVTYQKVVGADLAAERVDGRAGRRPR